jgi:hypothetical protein
VVLLLLLLLQLLQRRREIKTAAAAASQEQERASAIPPYYTMDTRERMPKWLLTVSSKERTKTQKGRSNPENTQTDAAAIAAHSSDPKLKLARANLKPSRAFRFRYFARRTPFTAKERMQSEVVMPPPSNLLHIGI